ncbi:MAG: HPr kinase/phosphorylase [Acetobacteraceae bacterium]
MHAPATMASEAARLVHASCVARDGAGVLLLGPPGCGKSDLALRLLARGFQLVADDQVLLTGNQAAPPPALAGLLEVRGLGIVRRPFVAPVAVALRVRLGPPGPRLPDALPPGLGEIRLDPAAASAPERVALALDCATGQAALLVGAFAA